MTEKNKPKDKVKKEPKKEEASNLSLKVHEQGLQIEDLKLAVTSLTKGLKGVYDELDTYTSKLNKVSDRLGL